MRKRIGEFLVDKGVLKQREVDEILMYSLKSGLRFGDAGMELGILTRERLIAVFGPNFRIDFFQLEPSYYPALTRDLFPVEALLKFGALPLGFKSEAGFFRTKRKLNLGMLDPGNSRSVEELEKLARSKLPEGIAGVRIYLILPDQFLDVLEVAYQVSEAAIRAKNPAEIEPALALYLENFRGKS
ncbi:MAG: hypothetical protein ACXWP5_16630 [Bdellovibrionota bacterium]